jgi:PAS domain S-box-containing protein
MKKPLKILIVEDNPSDAKLIKLELRKTDKEFESRVVQGKKIFLKELKTFQPDLILSDYSMPQFTGLDALEIAKKKCPKIPFIIVTGTLNEETAIKCMRWGAWDYVLKDRLVHLGHAVTNAIKLKTENEKKKLAEAALKKSEEQFRLIAENTTDNIALTTFDLKAKYIYVSPSIKPVLGYDPEDLLGKSFFDFIHPEDKKRLFPLLKKYVNLKIKKLMTGKESTFSETIEFRLKNKTGDWRFMQSTLNIVGKQLLSVARDITESKKAEEAIKESEERFQKLLENVSTVAVQGYNHDGIINYWNKANEFIYGYTAEEAIGKNLVDLIIPPEMREDVQKIIKHGAKTGEMLPAGELTLMRKDGKPVTVFSSHAVVQTGKEPELFCIDVDLTERKQAEEALSESEARTRVLLNAPTDAMILIDPAGIVLAVNNTHAEWLKKSIDEIIDKCVFDFFPSDIAEFRKAKTNEVFNKGKSMHFEESQEGKIFNTNVYPVFGVKGKVTAVAIYAQNITERKQAEKIQKTLFNISSALNTTDNMQDLYVKIREFLGDVIDTTNFYVALYDEKTDMISLPFEVDEKDNFETFPAGKTLTAYIIKIGKSLFVDDNLLAKLIKEGKVEVIGTPSKIWLGVPLKIENKVIGVIAVQSYDDPNLYSKKDIEMLTFVSEEIALAIKHKQADEQIKRDLEEKEILLQEIHHRVKNNMQIISSLLKLQSAHIKDRRALELFQNSRDRVKTMALIHDALYRSKDLSNIDFADYVRKLTTQIFISYGANSNLIKIKIDIKNVLLDISTAIPCGLIINELVSNSLKYAFTKGRKGEISISCTHKNQNYTLVVKDNGIGFTGKIDLENSPTLGLLLVNSLAKQLDGSLKLEKVKGTSFKIAFKKTELKTYGKIKSQSR